MLNKKNVNEGLIAACLSIPLTISEAIDIIKNTDEGDENERTYIATACSRCKKRHIKRDNQKPSCHKCEENGRECILIQPKFSRGRPKGLKTYCLGIPQTISKVIDIMNDIYESDENERSCVTTACSRCKKRHLKCDNQKPSCQNYEENCRIQPKISRGPQFPPENIVLDPNALSLVMDIDIDLVNNNYEGEVDPIQIHNMLISANVGNFQFNYLPIDISQIEQTFIGNNGEQVC
nr:1796_t:CDS:2 [Entrophospora candida]